MSRIEIRSLPVYQGANPDSGAKRLMLPQGEFTLLHPACSEIRFLGFLTFAQGVSRGSHYHPAKEEFFYLLHGTILLKLRDRETGLSEQHTIKAGDLVRLAPNVEHLYTPLVDSEAVEFSSTPWAPQDTIKVSME